MPSDWPDDASPRTVVVGGEGATSLSWLVPAGVVVSVESVVATVDATAVASTPRLTVEDNAGVIVTEKRQGSAIPLGATDRATWALRLADDGSAAAAFLPVRAVFAYLAGGQSIPNNTLTGINFTSVPYEYGEWIDLGTFPGRITVPDTGFYMINAACRWGLGPAASTRRKISINVSGTAPPGPSGVIASSEGMSVPSLAFDQIATIGGEFPAGMQVNVNVIQASGAPLSCGGVQLKATRVWKL